MTEGSAQSNHDDRSGWCNPTRSLVERRIVILLIDTDQVLLHITEISFLGSMKVPIWRIEPGIKVIVHATLDKGGDDELSAVDTVPLDPRHVMIGRSDPTAGSSNDCISTHRDVSSVGTNG
jgi:hypothetical protein